MKNQHNVYIVQCGSFIKIGIAKNLPHRLISIKTNNPGEIELLASFETSSAIESRRIESTVHAKLTDLGLHHKLEWFHSSAFEQALETCRQLLIEEIVKSGELDATEQNEDQFLAPLSVEQIRWQLEDRIPSMVAKATGVHYNTIRAIRDNIGGNPTYSTIQKLSAYLRK